MLANPDRERVIVKAGDHKNRCAGNRQRKGLDAGQAVGIGQMQVEQNGVERQCLRELQPLAERPRGCDLELATRILG
jgi:hypothetical protein